MQAKYEVENEFISCITNRELYLIEDQVSDYCLDRIPTLNYFSC